MSEIEKLWLDTETYSEYEIEHSMYNYADQAEIMLIGFAIDDEPAEVIDLTPGGDTSFYEDFVRAVEIAKEIWAHNTAFDRNVVRKELPQYDWSIERWRDTQIQAYEHSLPGSLDKLCEVLGLGVDRAKMKEGRQLIQLFCKPRPKTSKIRRATRETHPEQWEQFKLYTVRDVEAMREAHRRMPKWNYPNNPNELQYFALDQKINDRGFTADNDLVAGALRCVARERVSLKEQTKETTGGELKSTTERDKTLQYLLEAHGVVLPDMKADTIKRRIEDPELPGAVKELLRIRLQVATTSTSKYAALKRAVSPDGKCRGAIQFCGAKRTGRAAGRKFQPQNLPSRGILPANEVDLGIAMIKEDVPPPRFLFPNTMHLLSSAVRGALIASKDHRLCAADLSNIEGRLGAWYADEDWKLAAFRAYDAGTGHDLYNISYADAFKVDVETVTKAQRQIGKVMELFLQYEGGVGAFMTGAATYGFDIGQLARDIYETLPEDAKREAIDFYNYQIKKNRSTFGLSKQGFVTCDTLKRLWRRANSPIVQLWGLIATAARKAVKNKGTWFPAGTKLHLRCDGSWLRVRLPSGRYLCYPSVKLEGSDEKISYKGSDVYKKGAWCRLHTYGGKLFENICQATGREILYASMVKGEEEGFVNLISVHDELVTESPIVRKELTADRLSEIMASDLSWTKGLPLAAAGFESFRYRK